MNEKEFLRIGPLNDEQIDRDACIHKKIGSTPIAY